VKEAAAGTSKSAVSRRFVAATETALAELMSWRLDELDLVALMIDGVHFGEDSCAVALGRGIDGTKAMRWKPALNAFAITFGDRFPATENTSAVGLEPLTLLTSILAEADVRRALALAFHGGFGG
jgi:hypothetical protein